MVAALLVAIGMGVTNDFHISIGSGYVEAQKLPGDLASDTY